MAAQDIDVAMVFQNLTAQLVTLSKTVGAQAVSQVVKSYKGEPTLFKKMGKGNRKICSSY